jgi:uncharacterized protein YcbX
MERGRISAIFRYPVKSMAGELLDVARLSWHGIESDRRLAFRRLTDKSGLPWLTASKLPQLLLYKPVGLDSNNAERLPTHVCTPDGKEYELRSDELREEISGRYGSDVELMNLKHGIFDEACISVIGLGTVHCVERESGRHVDLRRFRPNVVIETDSAEPFEEDRWVGRTLMFGEGNSAAAIRVTLRDERCVMVNLDPDTAERDSEVMKTIVRLTRISHRSFGVGSNGAPGAVFHRPSSDIAFRREIVMLIGHRKGHKTAGKSFSFVAKPISSATPQGLRYGLRLKVLLEIEKSHFSSAGSPTPADIAPATDNWKPSRPKPCAPSPGSGRRSSAASYGSSIPVLRPVQSLSGPAASTH